MGIDAVRFGLAGGLVYAIIMFIFTLLAVLGSIGIRVLGLYEELFIGFEISIFGSLIGALYGFIFGFIVFFLVAFIYNLLGHSTSDSNGG